MLRDKTMPAKEMSSAWIQAEISSLCFHYPEKLEWVRTNNISLKQLNTIWQQTTNIFKFATFRENQDKIRPINKRKETLQTEIFLKGYGKWAPFVQDCRGKFEYSDEIYNSKEPTRNTEIKNLNS